MAQKEQKDYIVISPEGEKRILKIDILSQKELEEMIAQSHVVNGNRFPPEVENIDNPIQKIKEKIEKFGIWRAILIITIVIIISAAVYWLFSEVFIPAFNATEMFSESEKEWFGEFLKGWFWINLIFLIAGMLGVLLYIAIVDSNPDFIGVIKEYFIKMIPAAVGLFVVLLNLIVLLKAIFGIINLIL